MQRFVGKYQEHIFGTLINEAEKKELLEKTGIKISKDTKIIHLYCNDIHEYTDGSEPSRFHEIWDILDMDHYKGKGRRPMKLTPENLYEKRKYVVELLTPEAWDKFRPMHKEYTKKSNLDKSDSIYVFLSNSTTSNNKSYVLDEKQIILSIEEYIEIMGEPMTKRLALKLEGFGNASDPRYKKIQEIANHSSANISTFKFLVWEDGKYKLSKDKETLYHVLYSMEQFDQFIKDTTHSIEPAKNQRTTYLMDISTIKDEHSSRFKNMMRIGSITKEELLNKSFIEWIDGKITLLGQNFDMTEWKKNNPNFHSFHPEHDDEFLKLIGKYVPKKFTIGNEYIVREWDDMKAEYGTDADKTIMNKNKFPLSDKKLCGKIFTATLEERFSLDGKNIFPEETYEVSNMAIYTGENSQTTTNGNVNIFTDEVVPEPPKTKINKVGKRYFNAETKKAVNIESFDTEEIEITELQVNEKRYEAAMELGVEYDNLEEKSKRIQDIIVNELDSPEAVADKEWVYIYGASGSGKTTEAKKYFENKGQEYIKQAGFGQLTGDDLLGYKSITDGTYFRSLLRDAVEFGYGFIFDEMDACNPNTLLILNELKGEEMQFPDKKIPIHKDFRLIATGNTLGFSENYNARTKLDRATSARFSTIEYNLTLLDLAERWGGKYVKNIKNIESKEPREIQREIRQVKQKEK